MLKELGRYYWAHMKTTGIEPHMQVVRGPALLVGLTELAACEHLTQRPPAERAFCLHHRSLIKCHYTESIHLTAKLVYPPHLLCRHPYRVIIHTFPPMAASQVEAEGHTTPFIHTCRRC